MGRHARNGEGGSRNRPQLNHSDTMNTATFHERLKANKINGTARKNVIALAYGEKRIRPCHTSGKGRFTSNLDSTDTTIAALNALGLTFKTGNDAPRGGLTGNWIELDGAGRRKVAPIAKDARAAKAEAEAKEQAEKEAKAKRIAELFIGIEGKDVLIAWWKSGIFHPAPAEVIKAKEAAGMTWKEVRAFCKAH